MERHAGPSRSTSGDRPRNFSRPLALQPRPFSPHVRFAVESVALSTAELDVPPTEGASIDAGPAEAASPPAAELGDARGCATERQSQWLEISGGALSTSGAPSPLTCPRPPPVPPLPRNPSPLAASNPNSGAIAAATSSVVDSVPARSAQQRNVLRKARPAASASKASPRKGPRLFARLRLPAHVREGTLDSGLWAAELSPAPHRSLPTDASAPSTSRSIAPRLEAAALGIVPALAKPGPVLSASSAGQEERSGLFGDSISSGGPAASPGIYAESEYSLYSLPPSPASMQVDAEPLGPPPRTQHARDASRTSKASRASTLSTMQKLDLAVETRRRASGPVRPRRARYKDPTGPEDFLCAFSRPSNLANSQAHSIRTRTRYRSPRGWPPGTSNVVL